MQRHGRVAARGSHSERSSGRNQRSTWRVSTTKSDDPAEGDFAHATLGHLDMLYNLARNLTRSTQEAGDVVQETYLRALVAWERQRPDRVGPWLATICLNVVRAEYRRRQARPVEILAWAPGDGIGASGDTADEAIASLTGDAIQEALGQLPAAQREAITLMDLCRFTAAEVAAMTGVPRGTVLARVHRGHKRLAVLL